MVKQWTEQSNVDANVTQPVCPEADNPKVEQKVVQQHGGEK